MAATGATPEPIPEGVILPDPADAPEDVAPVIEVDHS